MLSVLILSHMAVTTVEIIWSALCVCAVLHVVTSDCCCYFLAFLFSNRSTLPKACLNLFKAVRALLAKPENRQLSLSYCEKASSLFRDSLNLGPHCSSSTLDKVCTHTSQGNSHTACVYLSRLCSWVRVCSEESWSCLGLSCGAL